MGDGKRVRRAIFLLLAGPLTGLCGASPAGARELLGQYQRWGAFREAPGWCFAMAEPIRGGRARLRPYVAVTRHGGPPRVHVAPSRPLAPGSVLRLELDGRTFFPGREDARIITAIRRSDALRVAGTDTRGRRFHDDYPLAGAPSAIDAAIVGCL